MYYVLAFNRTFEVLKEQMKRLAQQSQLAFNRTFEVLKVKLAKRILMQRVSL